MSLKYVVFLGSTREGRMGERVAKYILNCLESRNHQVTYVDPQDETYNFPMLQKPLHHYRNSADAPEQLIALNKQIVEADGIIVVSAEYNHSIPPALSNTMDHFGGSSYAGKPSGIVTYSMGPYGGVRAAMQLRSLLGELGCISSSNMLTLAKVQGILDNSGTALPQPENGFDIDRASTKMLNQLDWWAEAAKNQRRLRPI